MTDTVTRLMALADEYHRSFDSGNINGSIDRSRQALRDELQKLFTPLWSYEIGDHIYGLEPDTKEDLCAFSFRTGARWAEKKHGIGEAK